jgi:hypothetical protein
MTKEYKHLLYALDADVSGVLIHVDNYRTDAAHAAIAIRALVAESGRLREALGVLTACASSDDAFGLDDALSNARAALGETE